MGINSKLRLVALIIGCSCAGGGYAAPANEDAKIFERAQAYAKASAKVYADALDRPLDINTYRYTFLRRMTDQDGKEHVHMALSYKSGSELSVIGGDVIVHMDATGKYLDTTQTLLVPINMDTNPSVKEPQARQAAFNMVGKLPSAAGRNLTLNTAELVIYARARTPNSRLAWRVQIGGLPNGDEINVLVSAVDAQILDSWSARRYLTTSAQGYGDHYGWQTLTVDSWNATQRGGRIATIYVLKDPSRGNTNTRHMGNSTTTRYDVFNQNGTFINSAEGPATQTAVDAQYSATKTWDYFKNVHGRSGAKNDGRGFNTCVSYAAPNSVGSYDAFWDPKTECATFGSGGNSVISRKYPPVALDTVAHELTHAVTQATASFTPSGTSAALDEAISDFFGAMVEFYAAHPNDLADYVIGEQIFVDGSRGAVRNLASGAPAGSLASDGFLRAPTDALWANWTVHERSWFISHALYLLTEGWNGDKSVPVLDNSGLAAELRGPFQGIGRAKAEKIVYRALNLYMTSDASIRQAYEALSKAATDLYGVNAVEANALARAWKLAGL